MSHLHQKYCLPEYVPENLVRELDRLPPSLKGAGWEALAAGKTPVNLAAYAFKCDQEKSQQDENGVWFKTVSSTDLEIEDHLEEEEVETWRVSQIPGAVEKTLEMLGRGSRALAAEWGCTQRRAQQKIKKIIDQAGQHKGQGDLFKQEEVA